MSEQFDGYAEDGPCKGERILCCCPFYRVLPRVSVEMWKPPLKDVPLTAQTDVITYLFDERAGTWRLAK